MSEENAIREGKMRPSSLDVSKEVLHVLAERAVALVTDYFARVSELPIFPSATAEQIAAQIDAPLPSGGPDELDDLFADCRRIIANSRKNSHPRFFGYVASPATPVGAFADLIASTLNQN